MMFSYFNYSIVVFIFCAGLYIICSTDDKIKKLFGLSVFQVSILIFYISLGFIDNSTAPILVEDPNIIYSNPLPHVLMLTAIVVGLATLSVGLSIVIKIRENPNDSIGDKDE